jgi:hypothetical protein
MEAAQSIYIITMKKPHPIFIPKSKIQVIFWQVLNYWGIKKEQSFDDFLIKKIF